MIVRRARLEPRHRALPYSADALPTEYSEIQIRNFGMTVFDIRWDSAGNFKVILHAPVDWELVARLTRTIPF
jgi:hypothetical protein